MVAGLVVALVGVGAWALAGRGDTPDAGPDHRGSDRRRPDATTCSSIPQTPAVEARAVAGGVRFGWTYAGAEKGDTFRVRVAPAAEALGEAKYQVAKEPTQHRQDQQGAAAVRPGAGRAQRHELGLVRAGVREGRG